MAYPLKLITCFFLGTLFFSDATVSRADEFPEVTVSNIRRVFHNGEHNAFTDLVTFQGRHYLTFRSCPDGHMVHPTSSIVILVSDDFQDWEPVHQFSVPRRDVRDPHFLVFNDKLFVYTGTWYCGDRSPPREEYTLNRHLGYAAWSADGKDWISPVMLEGTFGHYIWKANTWKGKAYLCGRRNHQFAMDMLGEGATVESAMLESDDGLIWKTRTLFQERRGDETAFLFDSDGSITAIGRRGGSPAQLCLSKHPWEEWTRSDLDRYIGGPLLARWGDRLIAGGRQNVKGEGPRTSMYWFADGGLHEFARLPSAGDNSYPGFIELSPNRAVMSWYSSHEKDEAGNAITAIYMADLEIEEN